ncbi:MvaI/BcnI family restriction endonuclease [Verrucomicrobiales bacterium]|nr:MvaI/BcnI family restriction endonuclease [Verrucomicrobiales bacterium]
MQTRNLNEKESLNLQALSLYGFESTLLFVTPTGLEKSILDATEPMRALLKNCKFHNYSEQPQGPENKVKKNVYRIKDDQFEENVVSLYRPNTKKGDPRLWFYKMKDIVSPHDVCAVFPYHESIAVINLTTSNLALDRANNVKSDLIQKLSSFVKEDDAIAKELAVKLKELAASGPVPRDGKGDTAIGRSIETALGIGINSNPKPDYKGIELKSTRGRVRENLFAKVADWNISRLRSSNDILVKYGYQRPEGLKLYVTVSSQKPNAQGLQFRMNWEEEILEEFCIKDTKEDRPFCVWKFESLHEKLLQKHNQTFWIKAKEVDRGFLLKSATYTKKPSISIFNNLIADGAITMDHLSKTTPTGACDEKGPIFKINPNRKNELFLGEPKEFIFSK